MKLPILWAKAHQSVPRVKTVNAKINGILLPNTSEALPYIGWKDVDVNKKDVLSQEALFDEWNSDVIDVCVEAMIVPSNAPTYSYIQVER